MILVYALLIICGVLIGAIGHHLYIIGDEGLEDRKKRIDLRV